MRKILLYSTLILGSLVLFSMTKPAEDMEILGKKHYEKKIEKSFKIDKRGEVAIINKYGTIDMHTWDKNEVKITVKIEVNATSESVANDVFERITINFDNSKDRVFAETEIESKNDYWWNWGKNLKSDFQINYEVFMPISCSVDFTNKYGNIDMMDLENDAQIAVKYGNLTMGDIEGDLSLEVGYGKAYVGSVQDFSAEVAYSKLRCNSVDNFVAETKYSVIAINEANEMVVESKYDNYNIGYVKEFSNEGKYDALIIDKCDEITLETKYTDLNVGTLTKSLLAELNYGGIQIKALEKGFEKIAINSSYAGISINPQANAKFDLTMEGKYVEVSLPDSGKIQDKKDGSTRFINGSFNGGGNSEIILTMDYGFLKVK